MRASSLSSSSEFGACNHSTTFTVGYSRPMMGVTSKCSYWSSTPVLFSHGFGCSVVIGAVLEIALPGWMSVVVGWTEGSMSVVVAEGDMVLELV